MMNLINIPAKSTFKQNEVCQITGVKPYVLKFWEEQFEEVEPINSATGKKLYEHKDIEAIALIKKLLFEEKLTVDQAKTEIKLRMNQAVSDQSSNERKVDTEFEQEVHEVNLAHQETKQEQVSIDIDKENIQCDAQVKSDLEEFEQTITEEIQHVIPSYKTEESHDVLDRVIEAKGQKHNKSRFSDRDKQNLVLAKAKLKNMLMITRQIQSRNNIQ